ncbi:MAG: class I SAM-dependent methyltransferase [Desulfobacteraceae bacterium]|nr:class I SAM-dependent methyltransferase [Desulfobacteraceae bacterium]
MKMLKRIWANLNGKEKEKLSGFGFRAMAWAMGVADGWTGYSEKNFKTLNLVPGQTVIDYGCGPGRYLSRASVAVGPNGKVIAVDIHPIAMDKVKQVIRKQGLTNVRAVLAGGYITPLDSGIADVVYALEVFHMIADSSGFLAELSRLVKNEGVVIVEDGHQSREETVRKIKESGVLTIEAHTPSHLRCRKIY